VPSLLAKLLPGAGKAADYLGSAGLDDVRVDAGVLVARVSVTGRLFVEKARARG